jgi:hypothetical protein
MILIGLFLMKRGFPTNRPTVMSGEYLEHDQLWVTNDEQSVTIHFIISL